MSSDNCLSFLNNYADFLSSNTDIAGVRPHPILFSGSNCSGISTWIPQADAPVCDQTPYANPSGTSFGSIYIPGGWSVELRGSGTLKLPNTPTDLPVLVTNTSELTFSDGSGITNAVSSAVITCPVNPNLTTYTTTEWKLDMCTNSISTVVGARHLTSWQQGSPECDTYMDGYCAPVASLSCEPNSTEPAPLPAKFVPCTCLVEENCLRDTFCEPGNTNPSCESNDAFEEFIPVTCFGKNCSVEGYRWKRMQDQACTITLCRQIINLVGQNIVDSGSSTIWCGNRSIPASSVSPTPSSSVDGDGIELPTWAWILIAVGVLLVFVSVPLAIIVYRRVYKQRKLAQMAPSERSTKASF